MKHTTLLILLALLLISLPFIKAQENDSRTDDDSRTGDDSPDDDDDDEPEFRRRVSIDVDQGFEKEIRSEQRDGENEYEFRLRIDLTDDSYEVRVEFDSNELEETYRFELRDYLEYDGQTATCITDLNDALVRTRLTDWNPMPPCSSTQQADGSTLFLCTASTVDDLVRVDLYLSSDVTIVTENGIDVPLRPTSAKISVTINDQTDNNIALLGRFSSETELDIEDDSEEEREGFVDDDEQQISFNSPVGGFFSWQTIATIGADGIADVSTGGLGDFEGAEGVDEDSITWCFVPRPGGAQNGAMLWDPKLSAVSPTSAASAFSASLVLMTALFAFFF